MKKKFCTKYLTAACFLLLIGVFFVCSLIPVARGVYNMVRQGLRGEGMSLSVVESIYNEYLPGKNLLVTLNGGLNRLLGARCVNDRYLMDNGQLTYVISEFDVNGIAENTVAFRDALEELDIPFVYINAPFKIDENDKQLPPSVEDYSNENANRFLAVLEENNVNTLDLRDRIEAESLDHYSLFYPTDHHWTAEAGFWAYTEIVDALTQMDAGFAVDPQLTDLSNYSLTKYENTFLGSSGRRVGPLYGGVDDITLIEPKFDTDILYSVPEKGIEREGAFQDTVLFKEQLKKIDYFRSIRYNVYCGGDYGYTVVQNHSREKNLEVQSTAKKVLLIKDSFSAVVTPFLSMGYEEVRLIDLRSFSEDLLVYMEKYQPDVVVVLYNPGAYADENWGMFDFIK